MVKITLYKRVSCSFMNVFIHQIVADAHLGVEDTGMNVMKFPLSESSCSRDKHSL